MYPTGPYSVPVLDSVSILAITFKIVVLSRIEWCAAIIQNRSIEVISNAIVQAGNHKLLLSLIFWVPFPAL